MLAGQKDLRLARCSEGEVLRNAHGRMRHKPNLFIVPA